MLKFVFVLFLALISATFACKEDTLIKKPVYNRNVAETPTSRISGNSQQNLKRTFEQTRNRKQITGYYNPYNTYYNAYGNIEKDPSSRQQFSQSSYQNYQPNRKQDFGNGFRRPRPSRRTTKAPRKKYGPRPLPVFN